MDFVQELNPVHRAIKNEIVNNLNIFIAYFFY